MDDSAIVTTVLMYWQRFTSRHMNERGGEECRALLDLFRHECECERDAQGLGAFKRPVPNGTLIGRVGDR